MNRYLRRAFLRHLNQGHIALMTDQLGFNATLAIFQTDRDETLAWLHGHRNLNIPEYEGVDKGCVNRRYSWSKWYRKLPYNPHSGWIKVPKGIPTYDLFISVRCIHLCLPLSWKVKYREHERMWWTLGKDKSCQWQTIWRQTGEKHKRQQSHCGMTLFSRDKWSTD